MPESTINIFLGALMGIIGGLISTPLNAIFSWYLKQEEISYQHRLDLILKKRELLWQHYLERSGVGKFADEIAYVNAKMKILENKFQSLEKNEISSLQTNMQNVNESLRRVGIMVNNIKQQVSEVEQKLNHKG